MKKRMLIGGFVLLLPSAAGAGPVSWSAAERPVPDLARILASGPAPLTATALSAPAEQRWLLPFQVVRTVSPSLTLRNPLGHRLGGLRLSVYHEPDWKVPDPAFAIPPTLAAKALGFYSPPLQILPSGTRGYLELRAKAPGLLAQYAYQETPQRSPLFEPLVATADFCKIWQTRFLGGAIAKSRFLVWIERPQGLEPHPPSLVINVYNEGQTDPPRLLGTAFAWVEEPVVVFTPDDVFQALRDQGITDRADFGALEIGFNGGKGVVVTEVSGQAPPMATPLQGVCLLR